MGLNFREADPDSSMRYFTLKSVYDGDPGSGATVYSAAGVIPKGMRARCTRVRARHFVATGSGNSLAVTPMKAADTTAPGSGTAMGSAASITNSVAVNTAVSSTIVTASDADIVTEGDVIYAKIVDTGDCGICNVSVEFEFKPYF